MSHAVAKIGIEHGPAGKLMSKLHEHSVPTVQKILTDKQINQPDPPYVYLSFLFGPTGLWRVVRAPALIGSRYDG